MLAGASLIACNMVGVDIVRFRRVLAGQSSSSAILIVSQTTSWTKSLENSAFFGWKEPSDFVTLARRRDATILHRALTSSPGADSAQR